MLLFILKAFLSIYIRKQLHIAILYSMSHLHTANSIHVLYKLYTEHTGWSQAGSSHLTWIIPAKHMPQSSQFLNYKRELIINVADTYL